MAEKFGNAEIISADAAQVYKGLDIGTAKILQKDRKGIPHHLIDIIEPTEEFNVGHFVAFARKACNVCHLLFGINLYSHFQGCHCQKQNSNHSWRVLVS